MAAHKDLNEFWWLTSNKISEVNPMIYWLKIDTKKKEIFTSIVCIVNT